MPRPRPDSIRDLPRHALQTLDSYSYSFAKTRYRMRRSNPATARPVLVYTPGKVGSSSIASSLAAALAPREVAHLHYLTPEALRRDDAFFRERARAYRGTPRMRRFLPYYVWLGEHVHRALEQGPDGTAWDVVTMVRDPMQRNVSAFFQNLEAAEDVWIEELLATRTADEVADDLVNRFLAAYVEGGVHPSTDANPLTWFDDELLAVFDIDVYATPFPRSTGFETYRGPRARLLLMRLEDLSTAAEPAISAFFGVSPEVDSRKNSAADKPYRDAYAQFKDRLVVPASYLDSLYASRYSKHFYTDSELELFRRRWTTRTS